MKKNIPFSILFLEKRSQQALFKSSFLKERVTNVFDNNNTINAAGTIFDMVTLMPHITRIISVFPIIPQPINQDKARYTK